MQHHSIMTREQQIGMMEQLHRQWEWGTTLSVCIEMHSLNLIDDDDDEENGTIDRDRRRRIWHSLFVDGDSFYFDSLSVVRPSSVSTHNSFISTIARDHDVRRHPPHPFYQLHQSDDGSSHVADSSPSCWAGAPLLVGLLTVHHHVVIRHRCNSTWTRPSTSFSTAFHQQLSITSSPPPKSCFLFIVFFHHQYSATNVVRSK